ncbi:MAG: hypothetical protein J7L23_05300 [Candidatus Diapherotrites archaeon]|nr:hypothetical protein [Candidatus Diapherotrites archaeon]
MTSSKAQVYSTDFLVGVVAFLFVLSSFIIFWNATVTRISYLESERWRDETARTVAEQLVESPGYPSHWEQISFLTDTNIRSLGLADERNVLSQTKIQRLLQLQDGQNYSFIKKVLGTSKYDLEVKISPLVGSGSSYTYGRAPTADSKVSLVSRLALLDGNIVEVSTYVWE